MNTLTSVILSALHDTRDMGLTVEERAEAIADAVRAETPEPPTGALGQWIASLRVGDTLTVDDIHRFVRVELALRNADKHHQQARAMTAERDAIKANYDESVRECANVMAMRENVSSQLWDCMNERDGYRARLAACQRMVEQLRGLRAPSLCCDGENNDEVDQFRGGYTSALDDMRDILSAAVAAETCARSAPITVGDTQGETCAKCGGSGYAIDTERSGVGRVVGKKCDCGSVAYITNGTPTPHAGGTDA
jgi:hypothetical protein